MTNASKLSALALVAVVAGGALATPVLARSFDDQPKFDSSWYITQLRYDGVPAVAADDVNGDVFRATIVQDGHTVFEFFNKDSLQQVKN